MAGEIVVAYLCDPASWCDELAFVPASRKIAMQWQSDGTLVVSSPSLSAGAHRSYPPGGGRPIVEFRDGDQPRAASDNPRLRPLEFQRSSCGAVPPVR